MGKKLFKIVFTLFSILIAVVIINTILFIRSKSEKGFTEKYCDCYNLNDKNLNNTDFINWTVTLLIRNHTDTKGLLFKVFVFG